MPFDPGEALMYDDMRAELIMTTGDGWRLLPISFTVPVGPALRQVLELGRQQADLERIRFETTIAKLERQLDEALKPAPVKWWRRRKGKAACAQ